MKTKLTSIACCAFIAAALAATPAISRAADSTNAPAAETPVPKKPHGLPYHGKVAAVDANAMTFTVANTTYAITSATKITKEGKPAVFSDITVGAAVHGYCLKDDAGKATATLVRIGGPKKAEAPAPAPAATNAPAVAPK